MPSKYLKLTELAWLGHISHLYRANYLRGCQVCEMNPTELEVIFHKAVNVTRRQIEIAIAKQEKQASKLTARFVAEGRGNERYSDISVKNDALSLEYKAVHDKLGKLRYELEHFTGPTRFVRL